MPLSKSPVPDRPAPPAVEGFAFAPVCDLDHVTSYGKTEISVADLDAITCCTTCGRPARYQTIKRYADPRWLGCATYDTTTPKRERVILYSWTTLNPGTFKPMWTRTERVRSL